MTHPKADYSHGIQQLEWLIREDMSEFFALTRMKEEQWAMMRPSRKRLAEERARIRSYVACLRALRKAQEGT